MPRKATMRGSGIMDWIKKGIGLLRKYKVVSTAANALGAVGVPYASTVGKVAGLTGFGLPRVYKGKGIRLAGGALRPAGAGRKRKPAKKRVYKKRK